MDSKKISRQVLLEVESEILPNVSMTPVKIEDFIGQAEDFINIFSLIDRPSFNNKIYEAVKYENIRDQLYPLYDIIDPNLDYVRALRIYYGVKNDNIILIYVPTVLTKTTTEEIYYANELGRYIYNNGFSLLTENYIAEYINRISIKHDGTHPSNYIYNGNDADPANDVRAILFPMIEIELLYLHNQIAIDNNGGNLFFTCTTSIDSRSSTYKHTITISPYDPDNLPSAVPIPPPAFEGKAANLCNLCPPNCSTLRITASGIQILT